MLIINQLDNVSFTCQQCNVPGVRLGTTTQQTPLIDIPRTGDKLQFEELQIEFLVSEDMANYLELYNWIRGIGFPDTQQTYANIVAQRAALMGIDKDADLPLYSNGELIILNSDSNPYMRVKFEGLMPTSIGSIQFDSKVNGSDPVVVSASFAYTDFTIERIVTIND